VPATLAATLPTVIGVRGARHNAALAGVLGRLLDAGATIIVIDHDLDLLAAADHLIDMGPGGGPDGGHILAAGTPEDVARAPGSPTGPWLAEHLSLPEAGHHDVLSQAQTG
jgi:excinuclease UvrABC ATPase subunit